MNLFYEAKGGLGDILFNIFGTENNYRHLEDVQEGERAIISVVSSNPGAVELFKWHRNVSRFHIRDLGYRDPWGPDQRIAEGLPPHPNEPFSTEGGPINFYPSPQDLETFKRVQGPYLVYSLSAGLIHRNVPMPIAESAIDAAVKARWPVVLIGRHYENWNMWGGVPVRNTREEIVPAPRDGVLNLIDSLSVPGCAKLIEGSAGVFCCESAMMHLAWKLGVPTYVAVSPGQQEWKPGSWVCWGKDLPACGWTLFENFKRKTFEEWLAQRKGAR